MRRRVDGRQRLLSVCNQIQEGKFQCFYEGKPVGGYFKKLIIPIGTSYKGN